MPAQECAGCGLLAGVAMLLVGERGEIAVDALCHAVHGDSQLVVGEPPDSLASCHRHVQAP